MKDLESDGHVPLAEASRGLRARRRHASRDARNADAPRAATGEHTAETRDAPARKRRKRRRGRKVFAHDAPPAGSASAGSAPISSASAAGAPVKAAAAGKAVMPVSRTAEPGTPQRDAAAAHDGGAGTVQPPRPLSPPPQPAPPRQAPRDGAGRRFSGPAYAALDLGTNNCRLLVAVPAKGGQFRVVDAFSRIVRLGEGLSASGRLGDAAMRRALDALATCAEKLGQRNIRRARLIATEACRAASNGAEFLQRVEAETGLALEVIDRETEARLAVSGCGSLVDEATRGVVLFDIGGGSSEIALVDLSGGRSPRLAENIVAWTSLPVGVVSLSERFGGQHVTPAIFSAMVDAVLGMLRGFEGRAGLAHLAGEPSFHLLGTSGTVTTLAGIFLDLPRYDRRRVDGLWMGAGEVDRMVSRLLGWEFHQRVANPCIGPDRADLVLAGCAILEAIRQTWPAERLRVADRGLREGILTELIAGDEAWRRGRGGGTR